MNKIPSEERRTTMICVDSYDSGILQGRFYNPNLPEGRRFPSLMWLLQEMEQTLDQMDYPRAFNAIRTFAPLTAPPAVLSEMTHQTGELATFAVRVLFRQNASWQGTITWLEGQQEQSFRSVLEMILLLKSALSQKQTA